MRANDPGDTLTRQELRTLQRALRTRAANLRKQGRGQGLIRPLSKDDIGDGSKQQVMACGQA